jgi:biopolymer transport protein ExbB
MDGIQQIFVQGGWVSYALTLVSALLWSSIVMRSLMLRGASSLDLQATQTGSSILSNFIRQCQSLRTQPQRLEKLAQRTLHELGFMRSFIRTLVAVAPLLGLLGTVIGMVEMFGSMHGVSSQNKEATVAGGISTALITTQLGLIISAPGLTAAYLLGRLQVRRERDVHNVLRAFQEAAA